MSMRLISAGSALCTNADGAYGWVTAVLERACCHMAYGESARQQTSTAQSRQSRRTISSADPGSHCGKRQADKGKGNETANSKGKRNNEGTRNF